MHLETHPKDEPVVSSSSCRTVSVPTHQGVAPTGGTMLNTGVSPKISPRDKKMKVNFLRTSLQHYVLLFLSHKKNNYKTERDTVAYKKNP